MRLVRGAALRLLALLPLLAAGAAGAADREEHLRALLRAYPEQLVRYDDTSIYWRDGTSLPIHDGSTDKPFARALTDASILDQFRVPYPMGKLNVPPPVNADPGRFRNENFFLKMYGDCRTGELARQLVSMVWLPRAWGRSIQVTKVNRVAERLQAVSAEIDELPNAIRQAAYPIAGVLSCRPVKDTGRLSMHAYAAAIDLNLSFSDYWLWQPAGSELKYRNRMPLQIVDIFERHGFIWGGKWYHYDTMHFEYRPELLAAEQRR